MLCKYAECPTSSTSFAWQLINSILIKPHVQLSKIPSRRRLSHRYRAGYLPPRTCEFRLGERLKDVKERETISRIGCSVFFFFFCFTSTSTNSTIVGRRLGFGEFEGALVRRSRILNGTRGTPLPYRSETISKRWPRGIAAGRSRSNREAHIVPGYRDS